MTDKPTVSVTLELPAWIYEHYKCVADYNNSPEAGERNRLFMQALGRLRPSLADPVDQPPRGHSSPESAMISDLNWQARLGIGRQSTREQKIANAERNVAEAKKRLEERVAELEKLAAS